MYYIEMMGKKLLTFISSPFVESSDELSISVEKIETSLESEVVLFEETCLFLFLWCLSRLFECCRTINCYRFPVKMGKK